MQPTYSFVIPVYKSVSSLEPLYTGIADLMKYYNATFEVIFVEDNGSDESWKKLLELKKTFSDIVTIIKLTKNFGQNGATLCGIDIAKGEWIITIDDDLQVHPSELKKLINYKNEFGTDVIYGSYNEKTQSVARNLGSRFIKQLFNKTENGSNVGSSVRLINNNIAACLRYHSQDHLFINQVISWYTFDIKHVEIERSKRNEGESGYNFLQLLLITFRIVFLYTTIPLKIMIALCIIGSLSSLILAGYYIYQHFYLGHGLGFLSLIVFTISMILASISVIGIYLNRLYSARVKRPHYVIKIKL